MEDSLVQDREIAGQSPAKVVFFAGLLLVVMVGLAYLQFSSGFPVQGSAGLVTTASGLRLQDPVVGTGGSVKIGDLLLIHYTGRLSDGTVFDSSLDRDQPAVFVVGLAYAIPGWEEGVLGMREGGTRRLTIPPELAYGAQGVAGVIPPNETITFEIQLLEIITSVVTEDISLGEGPEVGMGDTVTLAYTGYLEDGQPFLSSQDQGQNLVFTIGTRQMLPGIELGVIGMKLGGRRLVTVPSELGFGEEGLPGVIPPGATLYFEIELIEVE